MKSVRVHQFGPESVLQVEEIPIPSLSPGQILVEIRAAGINPIDALLRSGGFPKLPTLPFTPGFDGAGIVQDIAPSTETTLKKGDRVWLSGSLSGTYAQFALCKANQVHFLPEFFSFEEGAGIGIPFCTAHRALESAKGKFKETSSSVLLVHGASGGTGLAVVQLALAQSYTVVGTAGSEKGLEMIQQLGCHHVLDHRDPEHYQKILSFTSGKGVDVIVEMLANINLGDDLKILAPRGKVIIVGSRGEVTINPGELMSREAEIKGVSYFRVTDEELRETSISLLKYFNEPTINVNRKRIVISKSYNLSQAGEAHHDLINSKASGRLVLLPHH